MRRVGQVRRRDTAEKGIRKALEAAGATIVQASGKGAPDLFVFYRGQWWAAEVKTGKGSLTPAQQASGAGRLWPIWRTVDDALEAVGLIPHRGSR